MKEERSHEEERKLLKWQHHIHICGVLTWKIAFNKIQKKEIWCERNGEGMMAEKEDFKVTSEVREFITKSIKYENPFQPTVTRVELRRKCKFNLRILGNEHLITSLTYYGTCMHVEWYIYMLNTGNSLTSLHASFQLFNSVIFLIFAMLNTLFHPFSFRLCVIFSPILICVLYKFASHGETFESTIQNRNWLFLLH